LVAPSSDHRSQSLAARAPSQEECARAHGINVPDPGADGTYGAATSIARLAAQYGQAKVSAVEQA
jgi:hypothetical protein